MRINRAAAAAVVSEAVAVVVAVMGLINSKAMTINPTSVPLMGRMALRKSLLVRILNQRMPLKQVSCHPKNHGAHGASQKRLMPR